MNSRPVYALRGIMSGSVMPDDDEQETFPDYHSADVARSNVYGDDGSTLEIVRATGEHGRWISADDNPRKVRQGYRWRYNAETGASERTEDWNTARYCIEQFEPFDASALHGRRGGMHAADSAWLRDNITADQARSLEEADYRVMSYDTPIAWWTDGHAIMPNLRYSVTTTGHQRDVMMAWNITPDWQHNERAERNNLAPRGQTRGRSGGIDGPMRASSVVDTPTYARAESYDDAQTVLFSQGDAPDSVLATARQYMDA